MNSEGKETRQIAASAEVANPKALDERVAVEVMGWWAGLQAGRQMWFSGSETDWKVEAIRQPEMGGREWETMGGGVIRLWSPSTDIRDAWEVAEKMTAFPGMCFVLGRSPEGAWLAEFWIESPVRVERNCTALSAPEAICLAALAAKEALRS